MMRQVYNHLHQHAQRSVFRPRPSFFARERQKRLQTSVWVERKENQANPTGRTLFKPSSYTFVRPMEAVSGLFIFLKLSNFWRSLYFVVATSQVILRDEPNVTQLRLQDSGNWDEGQECFVMTSFALTRPYERRYMLRLLSWDWLNNNWGTPD